MREEIDALNAALESDLEAEKKRHSRLFKQQVEVGHAAANLADESDLVRLGRADLLAQLKSSQNAVSWAQKRLSAATEAAQLHPQVAWLAIEIEAATSALAAAAELREEAYQAVISE